MDTTKERKNRTRGRSITTEPSDIAQRLQAALFPLTHIEIAAKLKIPVATFRRYFYNDVAPIRGMKNREAMEQLLAKTEVTI